MGKVFLIFLFVICFFQALTQTNDTIKHFQGALIYRHTRTIETNQSERIPTAQLSRLEGTTIVTYFVNGSEILFTKLHNLKNDTHIIAKHTKDSSLAYFYTDATLRDFSSLKGDIGTKIRKKKKNELKEILELECDMHTIRTSSDDIGEECYTQAFPYILPFDYETAMALGFPLEKEGLMLMSTIRSKITENVFSLQIKELIAYEYDDTFIMSFPDEVRFAFTEAYQPLRGVLKDTSLIEEAFRESASIVALDVNGNRTEFTTDSLKGSYTYIDVWATWCAPCLQALPHLKALQKRYFNKGLNIVSISLDKEVDIDKWKNLMEKEEMHWTNWLMPDGLESVLCRQLDIRSIPYYILLDTQGRIMIKDAPGPADARLSVLLSTLLKENED